MILVTGGTGLVGAHLLYTLLQTENKVRATYRSKSKIDLTKHAFSYYTDNVDELYNKIEWVEANLTDVPSLELAFKDITHVYHCAALVSFEPGDYYKLRKTNIEGTANIVNLCISNKVEKLCYVSSIATLGDAAKSKVLNEESHWNPEADNSVYAITKYGAEMEVWRGTQEGLNAVIVNPGIILGGGFWKLGSGSLFRKINKGLKYYTTGTVGFVDVFDVVKPMIQLMNSNFANQRYILIAETWSYKDFFTQVAKGLNVNPPTKEAKPWLLKIAWRLDWLASLLTKKYRKLTKQTAASILEKKMYSSKKIQTELEYKFKPIELSITETSKLFLKDF